MRIKVNSQPQEITEGQTVSELVRQLELQQRHVAVEVNLELVPREMHGQHFLKEGDVVEIVTLVGGG